MERVKESQKGKTFSDREGERKDITAGRKREREREREGERKREKGRERKEEREKERERRERERERERKREKGERGGITRHMRKRETGSCKKPKSEASR